MKMINELKPKYTDAVMRLMDMESDMITAKDLAPVVHMSPDVIIYYAKTGQWPKSICNFVISGNRVKFFREDFLRKAGYMTEPPPEKAPIMAILQELKEIRAALAALMEGKENAVQDSQNQHGAQVQG